MNVNGPSEVQIRVRAYEIYLERGRQPGHEVDDWLQAEFELTHQPFHIAHLLPIVVRRSLARQRGQLSVRLARH
jgi:hypothetical protein